MSKHTFVITAEFATGAEYEEFVTQVGDLGGEIIEESDF